MKNLKNYFHIISLIRNRQLDNENCFFYFKIKMNKIFATIINTIFFSSLAFAQLTEFSQGDILSAGSMNQNFKYLESKLGGINETTVNCGTDGNGHGINDAIQKGFNSIVINGICKENIKLDGREGNVPRLLKLRGANNDYTKDKIVDNSSYSNHVINVLFDGILVTLDNLTISGGIRTIRSWGPNIFRIENVKIDDYKQRGIHMTEGSVIDGYNVIIDGSNNSADSTERGIWLALQSYGWFENLEISNNNWCGLCVYENSQSHLRSSNSFFQNGIGIYVGLSSSLANNSSVSLNNNIDYGIHINQGMMLSSEGTNNNITITSTNSGKAFQADFSNIQINGMNLKGDESTSKSLLTLNRSKGYFSDLTLNNSGNDGVESDQSIMYFDNLTSTNNKGDGVDAFRSNLTIINSSITDNDGQGIGLHNVSNLQLKSSIVSSSKDISIYVSRNSFFDLSGNSKITSSSKESIKIDHNGSGRIQSGVSVSSNASNNGWGVWIRKGGYIEINSDSTISGNSGSLKGELGTKIDLDYGADVQSIECGDDNQSMVILNSSNGSYPTPSVGSNCISVKY